jgi:hypothetical protein
MGFRDPGLKNLLDLVATRALKKHLLDWPAGRDFMRFHRFQVSELGGLGAL